MPDRDRAAAEDAQTEAEPLRRLAASARGWSQIQLAVLGFIGFCGVFWDGGSGASPAVQWASMTLVVVGFVLAVVAVLLVARVAFPSRVPAGEADRGAAVAEQQRRLEGGIRTTYVALVLVVAATLSAWLPSSPDGGAIVVGDATGTTWCGELAEAPAGQARLSTDDGPVTIALERVALLQPSEGC